MKQSFANSTETLITPIVSSEGDGLGISIGGGCADIKNNGGGSGCITKGPGL